MAYNTDTLTLLMGPVGTTPRVWLYTTTSDADATIVGSGYFSDGYTKGMRVNDIVDVVATTGPKYKRYQCTVSSSSTLASTVAAPTAIT